MTAPTSDSVETLRSQLDDAAKHIGEQRGYIQKLEAALMGLVDDIEGLMSESGGVYGLHLNGDHSPWSELEPGGEYERLTHLEIAQTIIASASPAKTEQSQSIADELVEVGEGE